jgi:hypothetical protein
MNETLAARAENPRAAVCGEDLAFYVYLLNGAVERIWPATGIRLTGRELVVVFGEIPVANFPRDEVYFAARERVAPPVLF